MTTAQKIKIKPVTKSNWKDFEAFFKSRGAPGYCWCMAWRLTATESKQNNSVSRKKYIKKRVNSGIPIGILAYANDQAIAWCSLAPRDTFQRLGGVEEFQRVWSVTCFFIKKDWRDQGIIDLLIDHAKKIARKNKAKFLEAYPVEPDSPSYRFMGYVKTFEKAGFGFIKKAGKRRNVMIHEL